MAIHSLLAAAAALRTAWGISRMALDEGGGLDAGDGTPPFSDNAALVSESVKFPFFPFLPNNDSSRLEKKVQCGNRTVVLPYSATVMTGSGKTVMLCASPKAASSSIRLFINTLFDGENFSQSQEPYYVERHAVASLVEAGRESELCNIDFSLAVVRNPFDRLMSGYLDKVNRVTVVPDKPNATFADFVDAIAPVQSENLNAHWMPIATHCLASGPNAYSYTKYYRMEDSLGTALVDAFSRLGFSEATVLDTWAKTGVINPNRKSSHDLQQRTDFYSEQRPGLKEVIHDMYAVDVALGNYTADLYP
eukprot:TRINITY_DN498_c0_g2_i3.p1 TRINITY_DN498_c0_g2~~TRINITY_DN498_c0_g2_i3.p1  ORF type:complete len:306 (+),score=24.94 TRINITY_DN498_c0_g2_i3:74-991(+)